MVRKQIVLFVVLVALFLAAPTMARQTQSQNATSGVLTVELTVPTEDYVGVPSSEVLLKVTITSFSSNNPAQLWWGAWENDPLADDTIWEETIDPSTSDAEYEASTDTWSKTMIEFCDISSFEPAETEAEVYAYAQMTLPDATAQTADLIVNLITDSIPPDTSISLPAAGTYGPDITFQFTGSDDNTAPEDLYHAWKLDPLEATYSAWQLVNSKDYTGLAAGNYTFYVMSLDLGDNADASPAQVAITVETVSAPSAPSGPSSGVVGIEEIFTTSGAISSEGHVLEHRFDFGDGTITTWSSSTSAPHTYSSAGSFQVKAQARCPAHNAESPWSTALGITLDAESVSTPDTPTGSTSANVGETLTFSTSMLTCNAGHSVEYRFDFGDGTISNWSTSWLFVSHSYSAAGTYEVKAQARCSVNTSVVSAWSSPLSLPISTPPSNGGSGGCGAGATLSFVLALACLRLLRPRG